MNIVFYVLCLFLILTGAYCISSCFGCKIFNKTKEKVENYKKDEE